MMNKLLVLILGIALGAIGCYFFIDSSSKLTDEDIKKIEEKVILDALNFSDDELEEKFMDDLKNFDEESGGFINGNIANNKVKNYHSYRRNPFKWPTVTHSYIFGLEKMKNLMEKIGKYNEMNDEKIIGVSIERSLSNYQDTGKPYYDLQIVPITKKLVPIRAMNGGEKENDDDMTLNKSLPCPDDCPE